MKLIIYFFVIISGTVGQQELSSYPEFAPIDNFNFYEVINVLSQNGCLLIIDFFIV